MKTQHLYLFLLVLFLQVLCFLTQASLKVYNVETYAGFSSISLPTDVSYNYLSHAFTTSPRSMAVQNGNMYVANDDGGGIVKLSDGLVSKYIFSTDSARFTNNTPVSNLTSVRPDVVSVIGGEVYFVDNLLDPAIIGKVNKLTNNAEYIVYNNGGKDTSCDGTKALSDCYLDFVGDLIQGESSNILYLTFRGPGEHAVKKVDLGANTISTLVGSATQGFQDGIDAQFNEPNGLLMLKNGDIVVADSSNGCLRLVKGTTTSTLAGKCGTKGNVDGDALTDARLKLPLLIAYHEKEDAIIIVDSESYQLKMLKNNTVKTIAGTGKSGSCHDGDDALSASFNNMRALYIDQSTGDIYFGSDRRVLKLSNSKIYYHAGTGSTSFGYFGLDRKYLKINEPRGLTKDVNNNIYVTGVDRIIKIDGKSEKTSLVAGVLDGSGSDSDGSVRTSKLTTVVGTAALPSGEVLFSEFDTYRTRKVTSDSNIVTVGGHYKETVASGNDGYPAISAILNYPSKIATSESGEVYFFENNSKVRKVFQNNTISTFIKNVTEPISMSVSNNGDLYLIYTFSVAQFSSNGLVNTFSISDTCVDSYYDEETSSLYILTQNCTIYKYKQESLELFYYNSTNCKLFYPKMVNQSNAEELNFLVYNGTQLYLVNPNNVAQLDIVVPKTGPTVWKDFVEIDDSIYVLSIGIESIKVFMNGTYNYSICHDSGDYFQGSFSECYMSNPNRLVVTPEKDILVTDFNNFVIRKVSIVNRYVSDFSGAYGDEAPYVNALSKPIGLTVRSNGKDYLVADRISGTIRKVDDKGIVHWYAGSSQAIVGGDNVPMMKAGMWNIWSVYEHTDGSIYFTNPESHVVRKIDNNGVVTTVAGTIDQSGYSGDGGDARKAKLNYPMDVKVSSSGEVFIADTNNHVIRKVLKNGVIITVVGNSNGNSDDTPRRGNETKLNAPSAIHLIESDGFSLLIADKLNSKIRLLTAECSPGTSGYHCSEISCYGIYANNSNVCNSKGSCTDGNTCECQSGWSGDQCEIPQCYNVTASSPSVCSSHGQCTDYNKCACVEGWSGSNCEIPVCFGLPGNDTGVCNGVGSCVSNNTCTCNKGWSGVQCTTFSCYGVQSDSKLVCSGHGNCSSLNNCSCLDGWKGSQCETVIQDLANVTTNSTSNSTVTGNNSTLSNNTNQVSNNTDFTSNSTNLNTTNPVSNSTNQISNNTNPISNNTDNNSNVSNNTNPVTNNTNTASNSTTNPSNNGTINPSLNTTESANSTTWNSTLNNGTTTQESNNTNSNTSNTLNTTCQYDCGVNGICQTSEGSSKCICKNNFITTDVTKPCSSCPAKYVNTQNECVCDELNGYTTQNGKCICNAQNGFIELNSVCQCNEGYKNVEGLCQRKPAYCQYSCGSFGECNYVNASSNYGYCACVDGYSTKDESKPCTSCASGYTMSLTGKCVKGCPEYFSGEDCSVYTQPEMCISLSTSFCGKVSKNFRVKNTVYSVGAKNESDANALIISNLANADNLALVTYNGRLSLFERESKECNQTCKDALTTLSCFSQFVYCSKGNNDVIEEKDLCKSVCNYIVDNEIKQYPEQLSQMCSSFSDSNCYYSSYLPPNTTCYGKLYTASSVCNAKGSCTGLDSCECKQGSTGPECQFSTCFDVSSNIPTVCSGNGECTAPNTCKCKTGFTGTTCSLPLCNGKTEMEGGCSLRGKCLDGKCICNSNFNGTSCLECKEGFTGSLCEIPVCNRIPATDSSVCGGRGSCAISDVTGLPQCKCNDGYEGTNCQSFKCNGIDRSSSDVCNAKGKCSSYNICTCTGNYDPSTFCSSCLSSFNGSDCSNRICSDEITCNGHGKCQSLQCVCSGNFVGQYCKQCKEGYVGSMCDIECAAQSKCNGNGICSNEGKCICNENSEGENCQLCKNGYFGKTCDFKISPLTFGFSENGDVITGTVESSLKMRFECSQLIVSTNSLGSNPICYLDGSKKLMQINLGVGAVININDVLKFRKFFNSTDVLDISIAMKNYVSVAPKSNLVSEKTTISSSCGMMVLDASSSTSLDRRAFTYSWSTILAPTDSDITTLNSVISKLSTSIISFSASGLTSGMYTVQVTVTSTFSKEQSSSSISFQVTESSPPTLSIKGGLERVINIGSISTISPVISFPSCYKGTGAVSYVYALDGTKSQTSSLTLKQDGDMLIFGPQATNIVQDGLYYFTLTSKQSGAPDGVVSFRVEAKSQPLKVSFSIRPLTQSFEDNVKFSIIKQDPVNSTESEFVKLECLNLGTLQACDGFNSNLDQTLLTYDSKMSAGSYLFTATFTKGSRSATSTVKVIVSDKPKSTVVRVSIVPPQDSDSQAIDPSVDLILQSSSPDQLSTSRTFEWTSSDISFQSNAITTSNKYILIPKSLLVPGSTYTVSVKLVDGYKSGESTYTFTVNSPPTMGVFEINPSTGTSLTTEFQISCGNGWMDDQLPLSFKYMYRQKDELTWRVLAEKSEKRSYSTTLPSGNLVVKAIVYDSKGAFTETTTEVTVNLPQDASSTLAAIDSVKQGTVTLSSVSSVMSVLQSMNTASEADRVKLMEAGRDFVLTFFEQRAKEETYTEPNSVATTRTLSAISSVTSCASNLPDDTVQLIISKFFQTMDSAASTASVKMTDEEIQSTKQSADSLKTYVSSKLSKRSVSAFSSDDLNKIDSVYSNIVNLEMKNVVADMPAKRSKGSKSSTYARLVGVSTLSGLSELIVENSQVNFDISSSIVNSASLKDLESVRLEFKYYVSSLATAQSRVLQFVISSEASVEKKVSESSPIAQITIERLSKGVRDVFADEDLVCSSFNSVSNSISTDSTCQIISKSANYVTISVQQTGSYILTGKTTSPTASSGSALIPTVVKPNLDYIALIVLIVPIILIIVLIVGVVVCLKKKKSSNNPSNSTEMRETV